VTVFDGVLVDRITAEAREIRFWRTVLMVIAAVLFAIGWTVAKVFTVVWLVLTWSAAAVRVGWREARKPGDS
jgi:hypothetical protein